MRNYSVTNPEEKESYPEYKERRMDQWVTQLSTVLIEVKDSSLKPIDKTRAILKLKRQFSKSEHKK